VQNGARENTFFEHSEEYIILHKKSDHSCPIMQKMSFIFSVMTLYGLKIPNKP